MTDTIINHPLDGWRSADYWIFLAVSGQGGGFAFAEREQLRAGVSWSLYSAKDRKPIAAESPWAGGAMPGTESGKTVNAYSAEIILSGAQRAIGRVPEGSSVHVFQDASAFYHVLNYGRLGRISGNYRGRSGKKPPLANQDAWRALDGIIEGRNLQGVTGGPPPKVHSSSDLASIEHWLAATFQDEKETARTGTRNYGRSFSEWEL